MQAETCQSAVGAQRVHPFHHRVPPPHRAIGLQQADADLLAQQRAHVHFGAGRQAVQRQREQARHAFAQVQVFDHELGVQRGVQAQQARLLRQRGDVQ